METQSICPNCRKPLQTNVPLGLCPECLIKSGFPTGTEPGVAAAAAAARFVPPPVEDIAPLFPQLEIVGLIGKGGMGAVYQARQPALSRFVALKVLPPATASDPGFAERFNREARALARLNHPNIVAVHDFGKAGGLHYLVMEFVDGKSLREVERAGRLSPEQALAIVPQICEALQFAHEEGVVHRDIKPENILLDRKGRVKITDFGIAKIVGVDGGPAGLTGARDVIGTPHYMAPEQVEKPHAVDHRADIYSLGVVFYELLTGELPLGKFAPPSAKAQIDVRLDEVVLRTLEKEPERRYQHVSQVRTAVETIATGPRPAAQPPVIGRRRGIWSSFGRPARLAGAGALALLVGAAVRLGAEMLIEVPERSDPPFPVLAVTRQIREQMQAAGFRWRITRLDLLDDGSGGMWYFTGLHLVNNEKRTPAEGTVRLVRAGREQWLAWGNGDLHQMHFDLMRQGGPALPDGSGFGPVVERTIRRDEADERGFVFFDFETGRSLPPPFPLLLRSHRGVAAAETAGGYRPPDADPLAFVDLDPALVPWILANRMDVLIHFADDTWSSMNLRMQEDFIPEAAEWGQATTAMVSDVFDRWDRIHPERAEVPAAIQGRSFRDQLDRPKAFRTRSNTMGVMQWAGQNTTPRSVKIRYRLVESTNPTSVRALSE